MLIARELRISNVAEYVLYMWQIEDVLRACSFRREIVEERLVGRYQVDMPARKKIEDWYDSLILAMDHEKVKEKGHLQVLVNLVNDLNEFHLKMLESREDQEYIRLYAQSKCSIIELEQKTGSENEVGACLQALYGIILLKLKHSEISDQIKQLAKNIARLMGHLSARYLQFENDKFEF